MTDGWGDSAGAWIVEQGEAGDFGRAYVLDRPMQDLVRAAAPRRALDVGCGEGRFCRWMAAQGIDAVGIDPTEALLAAARDRDPSGSYLTGRAEALPFDDDEFDLAVSYLSLIDIPDLLAAVAEMARVLRPGGQILVANLQPYHTCGDGRPDWAEDGSARVRIDRYLDERSAWSEWRGIRVRNWHRPLSAYMQAFLSSGLRLTHFQEPAPTGGPEPKQSRYRSVPYFHVLCWEKPV